MAAPLPERFESTISVGMMLNPAETFSLATRIAGSGGLARTAGVGRDNSRLRFPSVFALFPTTHNVMKSLGSTARPRLSFKGMQAYILA